jgi:hypothetical protein
MITPWHDKDGFFKYYTADSAKLTLKNTSRKWSTPALFNDPFDNQFDLYFEEASDELAATQVDQFLANITSIENGDFKYTDDEIAYLREGAIEGMQGVHKITPETNAEIRRIMAHTTVFCVSETHDNLLMWSHYTENHTGVVIKFLSLPEVDSPIITAQPVRYTAQMPRLRFAALMDFDKGGKELRETITLSKGDVWAYEKEWRIIYALRDRTQSYEILPFAPEEVGAVYLGCKIAKDKKEEIIEIMRNKYPKANIFQAEKHDREFALVFREIT